MIRDQSESISLHDAELTNISIDRTNSIVQITFLLEDDSSCTMKMHGVKAFRSVDLILQNVVSRVMRSSKNELEPSAISQWLEWCTSLSDSNSWLKAERKQEWISRLMTGDIELLVIEPSSGSEMAIVCDGVLVHTEN